MRFPSGALGINTRGGLRLSLRVPGCAEARWQGSGAPGHQATWPSSLALSLPHGAL